LKGGQAVKTPRFATTLPSSFKTTPSIKFSEHAMVEPTALIRAVVEGDETELRRLIIKQPSIVNLTDRNRNTPLHTAASHRQSGV
jgi:hypothetical protein